MKEKQKNILVSAYISPTLNAEFNKYAQNHAQGNKSFALRHAIELLIAGGKENKNVWLK